jgi:hypothetical protein
LPQVDDLRSTVVAHVAVIEKCDHVPRGPAALAQEETAHDCSAPTNPPGYLRHSQTGVLHGLPQRLTQGDSLGRWLRVLHHKKASATTPAASKPQFKDLFPTVIADIALTEKCDHVPRGPSAFTQEETGHRAWVPTQPRGYLCDIQTGVLHGPPQRPTQCDTFCRRLTVLHRRKSPFVGFVNIRSFGMFVVCGPAELVGHRGHQIS